MDVGLTQNNVANKCSYLKDTCQLVYLLMILMFSCDLLTAK